MWSKLQRFHHSLKAVSQITYCLSEPFRFYAPLSAIFSDFFSQKDILKCACHGPDHNHTRQPSFLPNVYWVLCSLKWTEKCVHSSPCQRTAWLSMVHKNSPIPCVGKPFSSAQSRSSLLQNTETICWHVLKENVTKQCPTHDPSQQNPTLFILENWPVQSPGLPQDSSSCCVRKDEC